uniref:Uncharacterized protein n=1 Tax=Oryza brachyantha TaxID=4533 RepID=J3KZE6_ORYBR
MGRRAAEAGGGAVVARSAGATGHTNEESSRRKEKGDRDKYNLFLSCLLALPGSVHPRAWVGGMSWPPKLRPPAYLHGRWVIKFLGSVSTRLLRSSDHGNDFDPGDDSYLNDAFSRHGNDFNLSDDSDPNDAISRRGNDSGPDDTICRLSVMVQSCPPMAATTMAI